MGSTDSDICSYGSFFYKPRDYFRKFGLREGIWTRLENCSSDINLSRSVWAAFHISLLTGCRLPCGVTKITSLETDGTVSSSYAVCNGWQANNTPHTKWCLPKLWGNKNVIFWRHCVYKGLLDTISDATTDFVTWMQNGNFFLVFR
jgi:hypothetical protein